MIPELGTFAIILALCFSLIQSGAVLLDQRFGTLAAIGQFVFLTFAMLCLIYSFFVNDLTVIYVREHSHHLLPWLYRLGAAWGGHEGSLLLWCLILSGWTVVYITCQQFGYSLLPLAGENLPPSAALQAPSGASRRKKEQTISLHDNHHFFTKIISVLGLLSFGFILFLYATSNPFYRDYPTAPIVGEDLTPILQDPGLIFHPPMLYMGYVGFAIAFAFAIAALLEKKFEPTWAAACRPWIILPWSFLSCGIVLGSWWAYRELGWGGWWFWDPVENASLLPWLSSTALLHSLIVTEKRSAFKGWTILLAIITFALSLLGTFLVRSGVLVSVHTFASDPTRGVFLLSYLALIIGGALLLYSGRIHYFFRAPTFQLFSRETFLLINSVVLLTAVATIVLGTLYPIVLDALHLDKISVGEPYFNTVFLPIMLPLLLMMGFAPHMNWGEQSVKTLWKKLHLDILISILLGFTLPLIWGFRFHWLASIGITLGLWIIIATLHYLIRLQQKWALTQWAMILAHLGIAICVIGISVNKSYSEERQVKIAPGETTSLAGYQFTFKHIASFHEKNYQNIQALFAVGTQSPTKTLIAEQRIYQSHDQLLSKPGILFNPWRDLYLALGSALPDNSWTIRIYYKPLVRWIWLGGFLLLAGGILSFFNFIRMRT